MSVTNPPADELDKILDIVNRSRDIAYRASKRDGQEGVQVVEMRAEWKRIIEEARKQLNAYTTNKIRIAELKHSIGILDNVIMLGQQDYSVDALTGACRVQKAELENQLEDRISELRKTL